MPSTPIYPWRRSTPRSRTTTIISRSWTRTSRGAVERSRRWQRRPAIRRGAGDSGRLASCREPQALQGIATGQCIADLELMGKVYEPADLADRVEYVPL